MCKASDANPRAYLPFYPLVSREMCAYTEVRKAAKSLAKEHRLKLKEAAKKGTAKTILNSSKQRVVPITTELNDLIVFAVNTFVRPTTSELYCMGGC